MPQQDGGGKLPGKTEYSGRRRPMTRKSGFKSHEASTGGEFRRVDVPTFAIEPERPVIVSFRIETPASNSICAFGTWFAANVPVRVAIKGGPSKQTVTEYAWPNWNKLGSMWTSSQPPVRVDVTLSSNRAGRIALYEPTCGIVSHEHLTNARAELLPNMYQFSPEAHFLDDSGSVDVQVAGRTVEPSLPAFPLTLKSCNRCARFLPINTDNERSHLSFSNHCVADHRRPCRHTGFGLLREPDTNERLKLDYGFQLECRFCKKFEVNAAHNPKRTTAQMKEDAARRRGFELLIEALNEGTPQLRYRHDTGRELADDVLARSGGRCFNCERKFDEGRSWHLDHTRPLALLWPLDGTATALCGDCNSNKRDRAPADFYAAGKLVALAELTGIPLDELCDPKPNMVIVHALAKRLDWFFGEFLKTTDMRREHDGKVAGELLVKALQKVLERCPGGAPLDLLAELNRRRAR